MNEAAEAELEKKNYTLKQNGKMKVKGVLKNLQPHENLENLEGSSLVFLHSLWRDVGVFSKSLPLVGECSSYPNLKTVFIWYSPHSSLPKGFNSKIGTSGIVDLQLPYSERSTLSHVPKITIDDNEITESRN
ncbi:hypothetical protein IFM89_019625 [Coptis chinensis]|uniref:Uncharacterized protein n=1 Tax=Coptis chinensis TaxID=261450 RepID=A0A835M020_9MAGN|nr:hypothetical protein IFM89_019625 [Coptis chinensis]